MAIPDKMIEAFLTFWYPDEWPDNLGFSDGPMADEAFKEKVRKECREGLEAAGVAELIEALAPFAMVAERDIGSDETDEDIYRPANFNHAPKLTVGDIRRALIAHAKAVGEPFSAVAPDDAGASVEGGGPS
jgi:hypothetical protein